ncbi:hypothetical protein [Geobacillus jurassicus]|uniref:Uncharacterized protein n=1 Tax=Geobacillus jurassicus TaxID=235932 RepID=A0ABV6GWM3_9BACL|nr:hypothetical protein [Geobacillus jurassicus]
MYHVFFDRRPPRLPRVLYEQLTTLPPNVEVNVHTANGTYYNALFLGFEPRTNNVSLLVDRFYKDGGRSLTIDAAAITSIDLPVSIRPTSSAGPDDEEE